MKVENNGGNIFLSDQKRAKSYSVCTHYLCILLSTSFSFVDNSLKNQFLLMKWKTKLSHPF